MSWYEMQGARALLRLYIQPGARKSVVDGVHGQPPRLKIRLQAPPVDGKANEALIEFLADFLKKSRRDFEFVRGEKSRNKDVLWKTADEQTLLRIPLKTQG